jgi:hypothetical protein
MMWLPLQFLVFAVYAKAANVADPLASIVVGELPEPQGWKGGCGSKSRTRA